MHRLTDMLFYAGLVIAALVIILLGLSNMEVARWCSEHGGVATSTLFETRCDGVTK